MSNPKNAGRKPIPAENRKVVVRLYIQQSIINKMGGIESTQASCYRFIDEAKDLGSADDYMKDPVSEKLAILAGK